MRLRAGAGYMDVMQRGATALISLDDTRNDLFYASHRVRLTERESHLLRLLLEANGELRTNADLIAAMGGSHSFYAGLASLRALTHSIHRKLHAIGLPEVLVDVRGVGIRLEPPFIET
jgi:DNA-binding response OmpR family regulator